MAAKLSKTTAIRREKTPYPELQPLFFRNDWTQCAVALRFHTSNMQVFSRRGSNLAVYFIDKQIFIILSTFAASQIQHLA